ncbi:MAG: hypothetical protein ACOX0R_02245 [Candidatus Dojkabacteria bacterium]
MLFRNTYGKEWSSDRRRNKKTKKKKQKPTKTKSKYSSKDDEYRKQKP